ncbi:putative ubiquitin carboxyl-terminal hydrolase FAF-X [Folsomia candida]|uniref:Putative ubiquitin carboxyl-terminal hydrolase FAF-X n=1 Tax=Folsomia candida TaxID=158441 RepID=A0A226ELM7_FOLCA|nr:putative ubiquitin carboxyl-terminal hydrolase FAF-X [Folsomia candida]
MAKKMERSALDKLLSRSHLTETFQGDEAGAHKDDTTFPSKESAAPTPGPQGEDVPTTTTSSPPSPPGQGDAVTRDETEIPSHPRRGPGFLTLIGYFTLRIVFILAALSTLILLGLYGLKLSGIYDPCQILMVSSELECTPTPYLKGLFYHVECTKRMHCLLPGFSSIGPSTQLKDPTN